MNASNVLGGRLFDLGRDDVESNRGFTVPDDTQGSMSRLLHFPANPVAWQARGRWRGRAPKGAVSSHPAGGYHVGDLGGYHQRGAPADYSPSCPRAILLGERPFREVLGLEALRRYQKALERLDSEDRDAFVGRVERLHSYDELARSLKKPSAAAAKITVVRAMRRLANELQHGSSPEAD
jgi:DNA-directed RNA polymerase specialized sigma24 family protein